MTITLAPSTALCAECGCSASGDPVRITLEYDKVLKCELPTYRHITTEHCLKAQARSERFWYGSTTNETLA